MSTKSIFDMNDKEYSEFLEQSSGVISIDLSKPSEENLVQLFSHALQTTTEIDRARSLVDVANMCLALADKTLGAQSIVANCLVLNIH